MDAIALLCTLHADGPTTVRRLRASGCADLAALLALVPEDLAELLGAAPAVARRFQREARHLQERLGPGWDDRGDPTAAPALPEAAIARDAEPALRGREPHILESVLATWRRKDEECRDDPPAVVLEAAPVTARADALRPGLIDGLDRSACVRLAEAGILGVLELGNSDAVALAARTGLGFTRVTRWRSLARRMRVQAPPPTALDTAGPFA